jgi:malyl-CoA/(S)-citramalyl-CoA lyase
VSFTAILQAPARLHRSELAVPGSNPALFAKAATSAADVIFLDLEDAVAPDERSARAAMSSSPSTTSTEAPEP